MQQHSTRTPYPARLSLEILEGRALPSTTVMPNAPVLPTATVQSTAPTSTTPVATTQTVQFSGNWAVGPYAVIQGTNPATGNGKSTGGVAVATLRTGFSGTTIVSGVSVSSAGRPVRVAMISAFSSAPANKQDVFSNTPFTLKLRLTDTASKQSGEIIFRGTVNGTMTFFKSSLTLSFNNASRTQQIRLGNNLYTVTMPSTIQMPTANSRPIALDATVQVARIR